MNKAKAQQMFLEAITYCRANHLEEFEWAVSINPSTFKNLRAHIFLAEYCWVVYASGFRASTVKLKFPQLKIAFKEFDLKMLARMCSITAALAIFNNKRKATCFLEGSKLIAQEGFINFKKRLRNQKVDALETLPGIGPITKYHLGKNIGLIDDAKPDIWLVRAATACNTTVSELVTFLSEQYNYSRNVIDVVLWRHGADNGLGLSDTP